MKPAVKWLSIGGIFVMILALVFWSSIESIWSEPESPTNEAGGSSLIPVETVVLEPETLDYKIRTSGSLQAIETVDLRTEIPGQIARISFEEGGTVQSGSLLLKINDRELQAEKQRAQYRLNLAELREERQARLLERGGVSQQEYDVTLNEVNVIRSEIDLIEARLEKTEIRAPFDGLIGLKDVSPGSFLSSESLIARVHETDPIVIDFSIPERYVYAVDRGDEIRYTIQGRDSTFTGRVYALEPQIDRETRTLRVRARSDNPDHLLRPGSFANIELILESQSNALMVTSESVVPSFERTLLFRYRNGVVEETEITTGLRTERAVQITDGVAPGDTILTTGILQVRPGMEVDVTSVKSSRDR